MQQYDSIILTGAHASGDEVTAWLNTLVTNLFFADKAYEQQVSAAIRD